MELSDNIKRCLSVPDTYPLAAADAQALRDSMKKYPFFAVAPLMLLRHESDILSENETAQLQRRLAMLCSDRRMLAFAAHGDDWAKFYPDGIEAEQMDTVDVIDTFLKTYGNTSPDDIKLLERMIFNPAPDYAEMLAREEQENLPPESADEPGSHDALINAFIRSRHPAAHPPELMPEPEEPEEADEVKTPIPMPEHSDDSLLSESLAKIFIKQGRYERALEIISQLNLKFPKKSAYFADQMRFLQKLIINRRRLAELNSPDASKK